MKMSQASNRRREEIGAEAGYLPLCLPPPPAPLLLGGVMCLVLSNGLWVQVTCHTQSTTLQLSVSARVTWVLWAEMVGPQNGIQLELWAPTWGRSCSIEQLNLNK